VRDGGQTKRHPERRDAALRFSIACSRLLADIRQALRVQDASQVRQSAQELKGAIAPFTTGPAYQAAETLEHLGQAGGRTPARTVYETPAHAVDRLQAALPELPGRDSPAPPLA